MHKNLILSALLVLAPAPLAQAALLEPATLTAPAFDRVDDLIREGRAKLAQNDNKAARALFDEAAKVSGGQERAEIWQIRAAMGLDSMNDVLARIDKLAERRDDAGTDYLFGMAFAVKAQQALDAGLNDGTIGMQMSDSQTYLESAVKKDGERYSDAYPMLAHVAFMNSDLDTAMMAADKAVGYYPESATAWGRRARVLMRRTIDALQNAGEDEAALVAAEELGADAVQSFEKALKNVGEKTDDNRVNERAQLWKELGDTQAWLQDLTKAGDAYAQAMGWNPGLLDFGQLWNTLGGSFVKTLDAGLAHFEGRWGTDTKWDATLLWYLGYARYTALQGAEKEFQDGSKEEFELAAKHLEAAVKKQPSFSNGLWYAGLAKYATGDFEAAADAFLEFYRLDPSGAVATFEADAGRSVPRVEYIVGQLVDSGLRNLKQRHKLLKAADLQELMANTLKPGALNWSYRGLFLRDYADIEVRINANKVDDEEIIGLYEKSLAAYERALELDPENPNFMNDLAVVLHYNLGRDLERALELYTEAEIVAQRMMDDPDVDEQRKIDFIAIALRDAGNNKRLLTKQLKDAKEKKEEEKTPEEADM